MDLEFIYQGNRSNERKRIFNPLIEDKSITTIKKIRTYSLFENRGRGKKKEKGTK